MPADLSYTVVHLTHLAMYGDDRIIIRTPLLLYIIIDFSQILID